MAKVVKAFLGCEDGNPIPREFNPGDDVHGDIGSVAVREGWAVEEVNSQNVEELKAASPAENKAHNAAPENK